MAIFVIGMHRSGTSMVASILQSLGVNLGPDEEMVPANQFNEAGYFENAPTVGLNDSFLKKNDLTWRTLPAIETRASISGIDEYTQAIEALVQGMDAGKPWALKDPRLSFLLPYWKVATKPVSAIICLRRPDAAALSLKARNDLSISYAAALWELYTLAAIRNTRRMNRVVVVYEELLAKPKQVIEGLIVALPELAELAPSQSAIKSAVARVRRDLDHSKPVSAKLMPPAVFDLYERLASGALNVTKDDTEHGVAFEMVRLEAGHQAAKRLNNEAREQLAHSAKKLADAKVALARHTERLGDLVSLVAEPGEQSPATADGMLERLRQAVRNLPGQAQKANTNETARELLRAKDERIEWLRLELSATNVRTQTILDQYAALEIEVARLRAEHEQRGLVAAAHLREITRLAGEVQRLNDLLVAAEADRHNLQIERVRVRSEYEIAVQKLTAERGIVAGTIDSLSARLAEKEALIAQIQTERVEDDATTSGLRRIAGERETLMADLARATATLGQRNTELANLADRERELAQRAYQLDGEIERLQRDLLQSRLREADLSSALAARDQTENILRGAVTQQNALTAEIQIQLTSAREMIDSLEHTQSRRAKHTEDLETQHVSARRLVAEYEARTPMLEAAAIERTQLAARTAQLQAEMQRIINERDQAVAKFGSVASALESQNADLHRQLSEAIASARRAIKERDQALAAMAERDTAIRERDIVLLSLKTSASERDEARAALLEKDVVIDALKQAAKEREESARQAVLQKDAMIEEQKKLAAERGAVAQEAVRGQKNALEGLATSIATAETAATLKVAHDEHIHNLEKTIAELNQQLAELTTDYAASHAESAHAMKQAAELKMELAAARDQLKLCASENTGLKSEHDEMTRALRSARDYAEKRKAELAEKPNTKLASRTPPASDARVRRQLLVLNEVLQTIDSLLSPKYGRFAIPVRQIRLQLSQARQLVDGEVAMTRR